MTPPKDFTPYERVRMALEQIVAVVAGLPCDCHRLALLDAIEDLEAAASGLEP